MMHRLIRRLWAVTTLLLLAACGGGGGDAGTCTLGCDGGSGGTTETYTIGLSVQRSGSSVTSISSTETAQLVAVVRNSSGNAVPGVVVSFSESVASLLTIAPASATALTDSTGRATVEISASATDATGATTLSATAQIDQTDYSASTSIQISAGSGGVVPTPAAINFVSVSPADVAIVIKGAGGNGRTESATLTFRVVDASNAPIAGAAVNFSVNPANLVTLNITSATSDSSGLVTTTVQSGTQPTSVVVTATAVDATGVTGQSDTLIISNGVAVTGGFEVVAETYNLDGRTTGDDTTVSAFVVDANGNPVPDGVAVSFTTDLGSVGSSSAGGCLTVDGTCSVTFRVQDPRGGGLATVIGSVRVGSNSPLTDAININMAGATGGSAIVATDVGGTPASNLVLSSCKQTFELFVLDSDTLRSVAAGTTVSVAARSAEMAATVTSGSPVLDSTDFSPTALTLDVDATSTRLLPLCNAAGTGQGSGFILLNLATTNGVTSAFRIGITYPR